MVVEQAEIGDLHEFLADGHFTDGAAADYNYQVHALFLLSKKGAAASYIFSATRSRSGFGRSGHIIDHNTVDKCRRPLRVAENTYGRAAPTTYPKFL